MLPLKGFRTPTSPRASAIPVLNWWRDAAPLQDELGAGVDHLAETLLYGATATRS